jgi:hypothetical protein
MRRHQSVFLLGIATGSVGEMRSNAVMPAQGTPCNSASIFTKVMPTRAPMKLPGPMSVTNPVIGSGDAWDRRLKSQPDAFLASGSSAE